jgi:hypothetical protein
MIGLITPGMKQTGKRSAGKPHAAFDVAGAGNVTMVAGLRSLAKATELPPAPTLRAPALDPTDEGPLRRSPQISGLLYKRFGSCSVCCRRESCHGNRVVASVAMAYAWMATETRPL